MALNDELIGNYAYKKRGFYSHIIGIIEKADTQDFAGYRLVYKSGHTSYFRTKDEIIIVDESEVTE